MPCTKSNQRAMGPTMLPNSNFALDDGDQVISRLSWIEISERGFTLEEVREFFGDPPEDLLEFFE